MFQEQQPSYPNLSSYLIPKPNPRLSYSVFSSEPIIHPPGSDLHDILTRYPHNSGGFQAPPAFEADPYATSQNEVITQTDTITVEHADGTLTEKTTVSTLNSSWNYGVVSQHPVNDVIVTEQPNEMIQSLQCKVCKIICNTKDVFEKHVQGKKHKRNLQLLSSSIVQNGSDAIHSESPEVSQPLVNDKIIIEEPSEMIQSVQCKVCKIICNTKGVFEKHVQGKKHKNNLQMLSSATVQNGSGTIHSKGPDVSQHLVNDEIVREQPSKMIQSVQCKVCKIVCSSKDVFEAHVQGRQHKKNLRMLSSATSQNSSDEIHNDCREQMLPDVAGLTMDGELEMKKHKLLENGVSVDSLLFCKICNVVCNNQVVFNMHLAGKKHATQAATKLSNGAEPSDNATEKQEPEEPKRVQSVQREICKISFNSSDHFNKQVSGKKHLKSLEKSKQPSSDATLEQASEEPKAVQSAWCEICKISCNSKDVLSIHISGKKHQKNLEKSKIIIGPPIIVPAENPEASNGEVFCPQEPNMQAEDTNNVQTPWCDLCKIGCNSYDNLGIHIAGKKHRKNLEKLNKTIGLAPLTTASATIPIIGPLENPNPEAEKGKLVNSQKRKNKAKAWNDDLETKRQKMVKEGAASDSVRGCTICNVVCNSPMVFISHLAGQKHAAMAMKQAQAGSIVQNA